MIAQGWYLYCHAIKRNAEVIMKDPSCSHNCIMFTNVVLLCIDVLYCANKGVLNGSVILCYNYDVKSVLAESVLL